MWACAIHDAKTPTERMLLDRQYRLRAAIFSERLNWGVHVDGGRERDEYDDLHPTYILVVSNTGQVVGCARLLPVGGPTMLERTFPMLLASGRLGPEGRGVESSRFCVDTSLPRGRGDGGTLHQATLTMFAAIIEWSMANGYDEIVTATDIRFERILIRAGWPMERLGEPLPIGNTIAVAGRLPASDAAFQRVRPRTYRSSVGAVVVANGRNAA